MKTIFFSLALLAAFSFADNGKNKEKEFRKERDKKCHWVCEDGEMIQYNGSKKIPSPSTLGGLGGSSDSECSTYEGREQSKKDIEQISNKCDEQRKHLKKKRR